MKDHMKMTTPSRPFRVLIVDDEINIRRMLTGVLGDEGYDTEDVSSGEEALKRLQRHADIDAAESVEVEGLAQIGLVDLGFVAPLLGFQPLP